MRSKAAWAILIVCLVACKKPVSREVGRCLALPAAERNALIASPDGTALYWLENVYSADYDADLYSYARLMRYDLRSQRTDTVLDHAGGPVQFINGLVLATRRVDDNFRVVIVGSDGHVQELTPVSLDVSDVEVLDARTIAFLADGIGARAVYTLDLGELRPYHLIDADRLLSTSAGRVFVQVEDRGIAIDAKTRKQEPFVPRDGAVPNADTVLYVEKNRVNAKKMMTDDNKEVITAPRDWRLTYQVGSVLARTPPRDDKSYAYVIADGRATQLTTVVGGASIIRATSIGNRTWALIGHNTMNYAGDLATTGPEADICLLPADDEVTYATRNVPAQFLDKRDRMFDALRTVSSDATAQIVIGPGEPTTLSIDLKKEFGGRDLDGMRKRTRELQKAVTSMLGDREIKTEVLFADGRTGIYRWRRERLRERTVVGMGDVLLTDPAEFDFEVSDLDNKKDEGHITCVGTLRNVAAKRVESLDLKCSGNRSHVIHMSNLEPNEARPFSQTFDVSDVDEAAYIQVLVDGKPFDVRNTAAEQRTEQVFELATDVYAATRLALQEHRVNDKRIWVDLRADSEFAQRDRAAQEAAAKTAYERYAALRGIYHVDEKSQLSLRIAVHPNDVEFEFDGTKLTGGY